MNTNLLVSVILSTRNRPDETEVCLRSLLLSDLKKFEIIVVDQSDNEKTLKKVNALNSNKVHYYKYKPNGLSNSRNFGVLKAKAEIIAFTDSDCIVDRYWLKNMIKLYQANPELAGIFGCTLAYKPELHPQEFCPATYYIERQTKWSISNIELSENMGLGNNMSFRRAPLLQVGLFKTWLGAGSISDAGEDVEMIFRMLFYNYTLMSTPQLIVFHNRWMKRSALYGLRSKYIRGFSVFATYYLLSKMNVKSWKLIQKHFSLISLPLCEQIKFHLSEGVKLTCFFLLEVIEVGYGVVIGILFGLFKLVTGVKKS